MSVPTAMICAKCGSIFQDGTDEATLIVDFRQKHLSFICPKCKHDNFLSFENWEDKSKKSPLPQIKIMR